MMRSFNPRFLVIALALLLGLGSASCSATGSVSETSELKAEFGAYRTAKVEVTAANPDWEHEARVLEGSLVARLEPAIFTNVRAASSHPEPGEGVCIRAHVVELSRVSTTGRQILGGLAGRAHITVEVSLADEGDGHSLGAFKAVGKSSGGTAFAGDTDQAIQELVQAITAHLSSKRSATSSTP